MKSILLPQVYERLIVGGRVMAGAGGGERNLVKRFFVANKHMAIVPENTAICCQKKRSLVKFC